MASIYLSKRDKVQQETTAEDVLVNVLTNNVPKTNDYLEVIVINSNNKNHTASNLNIRL